MYAVIKTGGKQYRVSEGDCICIEKLEAKLKKKIIVKVDKSFHQENYEIISIQ